MEKGKHNMKMVNVKGKARMKWYNDGGKDTMINNYDKVRVKECVRVGGE